MKNLARLISASAISLAILPASSFALSVTQENDASVLASSFLGTGITIVGTPTLVGDPMATGTFSNGLASGLPFDEGIILSTGNIDDAVGPNTDSGTSTDFGGGASDPDLSASIGGEDTNDVVRLEFDFETDTGDVLFNYIFASEEYEEFVDAGFNDVFGFFLDGANVALLPGTSTPVSVDSVSPSTNPGLYVSNDVNGPIPPATSLDIEFDGLTTLLTVDVTGLAPGTHTIALAIADVGDNILDSAVFLQADTFSAEPSDPIDNNPKSEIPEPATTALLGMGLLAAARIRKGKVSQ